MQTKQQIILLFVFLGLTLAQKPCSQYEYDELGCVSSTYEACQWNEFQSSCKPTFSTNIGCSISLNRLGCIKQMQYPNQEWAYCNFSGYCRDISGVTDCLPTLSKPACMAVNGKACFWVNQCVEMTSEQMQSAVMQAQNSIPIMNESNIDVCQQIQIIPVMHQSGATQYIKQLINTFNSDETLIEQYLNWLTIPGCLEVDKNLLNLIICTGPGINSVACSSITTPGQKCQFINNSCQNVIDVSNLNCADQINKEACLSITNIKQPCYWSSNTCLKYTGDISCDLDISPVSLSFCASVKLEQECFYNQKKKKCSQRCRSENLLMNKKICNSSNHNCFYQNTTCLFKGVQSQCGIIGQNKYSCMNVNENCQFFNGICKKMNDLSTAKCTDNLNRQACINLKKVGQICYYDSEYQQCLLIKLSNQDICIEQYDVNENVCKRMTDSACYWNNGNCENPQTNISCTVRGLNKIGCLASTQNQCQWNQAIGECQNITITKQTMCNSLKLVNANSCERVSYINVSTNELCKYNEQTQSCETFTAEIAPLTTYTINCLTPGLNRAGCLSVADPTIACKWTIKGCILVTSVSSGCSGLIGVTAKVCALAQGEQCTFNSSLQRCIASVIKNPDTCTSLGVLNGYGCAFIEPKNGAKCYFDSNKLECLEANTPQLSILNCSSYPNKATCLAITTTGQICQWNVQKYLCEYIKIPYISYCTDITYVNINGCIGFEIDVNSYINYESYCTNGDTVNTCKLFDIATPNTNCFSAANPNLHACVALTSGQNCYFDTATLKCTTMNAGQESILQSILCKQGNKDLCNKIKTKDQYCIWDDTQNKCYNDNQCTSALNQTSCTATTQPCAFKNGQCVRIQNTNAVNYQCIDAANEQACYQVAGQSCTFDGSSCIELTQDLENDTCTTYSDKKVNAIACGKITKSGEYCQYDITNNKCITNQITTYDICEIGQNEANCITDKNCNYNTDQNMCQSKPSICNKATTLNDCMMTKSTCMWTTEGKCKQAPINVSCVNYTTTGYKYNTYTCGSVRASDKNKICAQNPDTLLCEELISSKCSSTTSEIDCSNIRNKCKYDSKLQICSQQFINPKKCSDNYTKFACLTGKLKCVWDLESYLCSNYESEDILCQTINSDGSIIDVVQPILSAEVCYSKEEYDCYLDLTTLGCTKVSGTQTTCAEAKTPKSCQLIQDEQLCYWDNDMICKGLTDLSKGANLTYIQVQHSQKTVCLLPQQEGEYSQWKDQACVIPDNSSTKCTDQLNIRACQVVLNDDPTQYCIYKNSFCQNADLSTALCSESVNYYTCISITTPGQFCVWLRFSCAAVNDDGYTIGKYSTTNMHTCTKTYTINGAPDASIKNPLGVKFSQNGCVLSEPDIDICTTSGLNYYGCLQSKAGACTWNGKKCVNFTQFSGKSKCSDFQMVSAGVCIQVQNLKCTWSNYKCIDATTTQQCTDNLSQASCVMQTTSSCKWENNKCQNQIIKSGITQCGQSNFSTSQFSSVLSCQSVQYGIQPCRHNGFGCTTELDLLTAKCSTPGLNDVACTMIKLEKCIYMNGICQVYYGNYQQCKSLIAVSPQVCSEITDPGQFCKYSQLSNKCTIVNNYDLCTSVGINSSGCNFLPNCKWHKDLNYCSCAASLNGIKFCADYDKIECQKQSNCIIDSNLNVCRMRQCSDLSIKTCSQNANCYITKSGICESAATCNDVRNVDDCTKIEINGIKCQTHTKGICRLSKCSDNLTDSSCNGNCIWLGSYCDKKVCQQFGKKEQCQGTYENSTCFWFNNVCFGLGSCSELAQYITDEVDLQTKCISSIINGNQCHWQIAGQYQNQYECSNNQCNPLGSSKINCVGAEIDQFVCILSHDFQCLRCEDIINECECLQQKGNCEYANNKCKSIQCIEYQQQSCELFPDKCVWHSNSNKCLIVCSKLEETACKVRSQETNQCYWETNLKKCNSGQEPIIKRDTVSVQIMDANITITVSNARSIIIILSIIIELLL